MKIKLLILNSFLLAYFVIQSANLRAAGSESKERAEIAEFRLSIFGKGGYNQKIQEYNANITANTVESLKLALEILEFIKSHAMKDILNNIPLRVYLATWGFYPLDEINSDNPIAHLNSTINSHINEINKKFKELNYPMDAFDYIAYTVYLSKCTRLTAQEIKRSIEQHLPPGLPELIGSYKCASYDEWVKNTQELLKVLGMGGTMGDVEKIKKLIKLGEVNVNKYSRGKTPLILSISSSKPEFQGITDLLLSNEYIDVNAADLHTKETPLLLAIKRKSPFTTITKLLSRKDIDVNAKDQIGLTALMWAAYKGYIDIVKLLLSKKDIDINARDKRGETALSLAMTSKHEGIVKLLRETTL